MCYRARHYDSKISRFIKSDPNIHIRCIEHYLYAHNNSMRNTDPRGEYPQDELSVAGMVGINITGGRVEPFVGLEVWTNGDMPVPPELIYGMNINIWGKITESHSPQQQYRRLTSPVVPPLPKRARRPGDLVLPDGAKALFSLIYSDRVDLDQIVVREEEPWFLAPAFKWAKVAAITWGHTIYMKSGYYSPNTASGLALIGHELYHVYQHGGSPLFYPLYVGATVPAMPAILDGGYSAHPFEAPAYDVERLLFRSFTTIYREVPAGHTLPNSTVNQDFIDALMKTRNAGQSILDDIRGALK